MFLSNRSQAVVVGLATLLLAVAARAEVNKSVHIGDGETASGASSVNGAVTVGRGATVNGDVETVNGTIRIDDNAVIEDASTVNGGIKIGSQVRTQSLDTVNGTIRVSDNGQIDGSISAVNGAIDLGAGTFVDRNVGNVNGAITLEGVEVGGDVETVNGDIELSDGAAVHGDVIVEKPKRVGWFGGDSRVPEIIIGPGCRVDGTLRLKREVKLYISESAVVGGVDGVMSMSDAVRFSGNRP